MTDPNATPFNSQPTEEELKVREWGPGRVPSPPVGELPAGGAKWPVPHHETKVSLINLASRAYRWTHDEALKSSRKNARAMLRDLVIRNALVARFTPVVQLSWHLRPRDYSDPMQVEAAAKLTQVVERTPKLQDLFLECLWAEWFGRAGVSLLYEWERVQDEMWMVVRDHRPINGDSLVARWSGDWGILVHGGADVDKDISDGSGGQAHYFTPDERESVVIHTAPKEDSDFFDGDLAGQIVGSGIRGHIYWIWFLKSNYQALLADFSERFAQGVWVAYYETGNEEGKTYMEQAVAGYKNNRCLMIPQTESKETAFDLKILEVGNANPLFLQQQIEKFEELIHKYITFQDVNSLDVPMGGDGAGVVMDRISRGIKYSAKRLAETLSTEWVSVLAKYNTPGVPAPTFEFDVDSPNAGEVIGYASALHSMGGPIDLDHLYEIAGLPMPAQDSTVASKVQPMSPVVGQAPTGVPEADPAQPQPDQQQTQPPPQQAADSQPQQQKTILD